MINAFFQALEQGSMFAVNQLAANPDYRLVLKEQNQHIKPPEILEWQTQVAEICASSNDELSLMRGLRQHRNLTQIGIIGRDFARLQTPQQSCRQLSDYAETVINGALVWLYQKLVVRYGVPCNKQGEAQHMQVIAMGKLGAQELNFSSDIDLIFTFGEKGYTDGEKSIDNERFFARLAQQLIKVLDQRTADGFVFRVDMRLRPYGQSGALVSSFAAFEEYYLTQGREWERYAMIKARVITGSERDSTRLDTMIKRFAYRQYTDYGLLESLRDMKRLIQAEEARRGNQNNIKLGRGGIRELEFIAQAFQLLKGGRILRMQQRAFNAIMPAIASLGWLDPDFAQQLLKDYWFLRDIEHRIQAWNDEQTQLLNDDAIPRIASLMGYTDSHSFTQRLEETQNRVAQAFDEVIKEESAAKAINVDHVLVDFWLNADSDTFNTTAVPESFQPLLVLAPYLGEFKQKRPIKQLQDEGLERLNKLMPLLLAALAVREEIEVAYTRIEPLILAVIRRSVYLQLLIDNPWALAQALRLCEASPWVAHAIATHPSLLETLADQALLYQVPKPAELRDQLRQQVSRVPLDDVETHMDILRHFKQSTMLRVAACEINETLPLMKVSDALTFLAEVILDHVVELAWFQLVERHGRPVNEEGDEVPDLRFTVVGYGKLGGIEMGYSSDLDLVFLHDCPLQKMTGGAKPIDNSTFYARMGKRVIHLLSTRTSMGELYEVDMRLRPSGNSGMLVTTLAGLEKYQLNDAWVWEHQALVRARAVAGDGELAQQFSKLRKQILQQPRELISLANEVVKMRSKMVAHLGTRTDDQARSDIRPFHIKHDPGGVVDIEFLVQFVALGWANKYPQLVEYTDNIRILNAIELAGLLNPTQVEQLVEAYKAYRSTGHLRALQQQSSTVDAALFEQQQYNVSSLWRSVVMTEADEVPDE